MLVLWFKTNNISYSEMNLNYLKLNQQFKILFNQSLNQIKKTNNYK